MKWGMEGHVRREGTGLCREFGVFSKRAERGGRMWGIWGRGREDEYGRKRVGREIIRKKK